MLRYKNEEAKEIKQKTLPYYEEHEGRMFYKTFWNRGLSMGAGPIEVYY